MSTVLTYLYFTQKEQFLFPSLIDGYTLFVYDAIIQYIDVSEPAYNFLYVIQKNLYLFLSSLVL